MLPHLSTLRDSERTSGFYPALNMVYGAAAMEKPTSGIQRPILDPSLERYNERYVCALDS